MRILQAGDMMWLADEYRRRSHYEPSLTLEDFADQYGVIPHDLLAYIPELSKGISHSVVLWHGTSKSRAESILREGFRAKKAEKKRREKGRIYFARRRKMAYGYARSRARSDGDRPAIIMCAIDLNVYSNYELQGSDVYVFEHECIGSEVVRKVDGLTKQRLKKLEKRELGTRGNASAEFTNVALTFSSGSAGIAYWINNYLMLDDQSKLRQDHSAVGKIKQWLDAQADAGRFGEVSDEEMLLQMQKHLRIDSRPETEN
jgi:hypothetical protein